MSNTKEHAEVDEPDETSKHRGPWFTSLKMDEAKSAIGTSDTTFPTNTLGLAISGGGIRSATFALGILQSLARADWLKHIDFLSTVSGGGYVGTFLGRYFDQLRRVLTPGPNGKFAAHRIVASTLQDSHSHPMRWLRQQSNYLAPTGSGEELFNFATFWRNFMSLHFVLGMLFLSLFGAMNAITYSHWFTPADRSPGSVLKTLAPLATTINSEVTAAWWILAEIMIWVALLPLVLSYWLVSQERRESLIVTVLISYLLLAIAATLAIGTALPLAVFAATVCWMVLTWHEIRHQVGSRNPNTQYALLLSRNILTQKLAWATRFLAVIMTLGFINVLGYRLSGLFIRDDLTWSNVVTRVGLLSAPFLAAAPIMRAIAGILSTREDHPKSFLNTLARLPYLMNTIMVLVGTVLPLAMVAFISHASFGNGGSYAVGVGATVLAIVVSFILGHREALPFVNRSGPFAIYAARLARVFLGAVNPARQRQARGSDVTTVVEGDDVAHDNYQPHVVGGPLHLFNVTVNETVDVASQRGLRDRQGENMAIGPAGISISRDWHSLWGGKVEQRILVSPIVNGPQVHPFVAKDCRPVYVERLSIRQWMAISGAAISSGAGRYSGAAFSLLVTLANLRLGYWWDSGLWAGERAQLPIARTKMEWLRRCCYRCLAVQSLLVSELRGRFGGPWRRHFYLSDGGHFENTGVYELLRRRVPYIIAIDAGHDRLQQGTGLGELTRIARIDFGCSFEELPRPALASLGVPPNATKILGSIDDLLATKGTPNANCHATLLRVRYPRRGTPAIGGWTNRNQSWLLYIRLSMDGDEPADLLNYRATHPYFPNQTTLDQDFDEPQFESYRQLGQHIGDQLF